MAEVRPASHFASLEQQATAARLGMWVFMGSETLLFAALFGLYVAYRVAYPDAFDAGARETSHALGAVNTAVLLTSSLCAALGVDALERGRRWLSTFLVGATAVLGVVFLVVKGLEYAEHIRHGMVLGGHTAFFAEHAVRGLPLFVALYYAMTGLHAAHVAVGIAVLSFMVVEILRGRVREERSHPLELGVLYWHLVDAIWVFLWPMFYFSGVSR